MLAYGSATTRQIDAPTAQRTLVRQLRGALAAAQGGAPVELIETHISYVLLTGRYAYKIKKTLDLGFLNFSTLAARRFFCAEELRLNRRYAPKLYLDVVAITGSAETPLIEGTGEPIEYAVKMRQFPQENLFDRLLVRSALLPRHIDALAAKLAEFHARVDRVAADLPAGTPERVRRIALENFVQIETLLGKANLSPDFAALRQWTEQESAARADALSRRRADGFIRACHGDLHLGNVALVDDEVTPFDGIEFSDDLRWVDVMNEVAFLLMDLEYRSRPDLAARFLNAYLEHTADYAGLEVLRFYLVHRAMVRAKVSCIRLAQAGVDASEKASLTREYESHLNLAKTYVRPKRAALVITHGVSGCGKTTLTQSLVALTGAIRIRSDVERKRLLGLPPLMRAGAAAGQGIYSGDMTERTYRRLLALAQTIVAAGHIVIVDATFLQRWQRQLFRDLAAKRELPFVILSFIAADDEVRSRIAHRANQGGDASDATLTVLAQQLSTREPLSPAEQALEIRYTTGGLLGLANVRETWEPLLQRLGL